MRRALLLPLLILLVLPLLACKAHAGVAVAVADAGPAPGGSVASLSPSQRPYGFHVPAGWDRTRPAPLVMFFHGYGGTGASAVALLRLQDLSDASGFVLVFPDGTPDSQGHRFWNATDACCDFEDRGTDDVAYAAWILDDVESKLPIDRKRVYAMGHSNGAFLSLRLACELSPRLAAVVSIAGAAWKDDTKCRPTQPVSVLQVQGDADTVVHLGGGMLFDRPGRAYPSALTTVSTFAIKDRCNVPLSQSGRPFDFDLLAAGSETIASDYGGCPPGINVTLWTVAGGSHFPSPTQAGLNGLWAWMAAHPKR